LIEIAITFKASFLGQLLDFRLAEVRKQRTGLEMKGQTSLSIKVKDTFT